MRRFELKAGRILAIATILLGACAQQAPVIRAPVEPKIIVRPPPPRLEEAHPAIEPELDDLLADVKGDT